MFDHRPILDGRWVEMNLSKLSILPNSNLLYLASSRSELKEVNWMDGWLY